MHKEIMKELTQKLIKLALEEDLSPNGDISLNFLENSAVHKKAQIIAKEDGVMACSWIAEAVFDEYKKNFSSHCERSEAISQIKVKDGEEFKKGDILLELEAPANFLLSCERTILNFLQRLCAIATATRKLSSIIKNYPCKLLDTRKTMPGMRALEKEAFKTGGGENHRFNLSDAVMLKENHLAVIASAAWQSSPPVKTIVEINKDNLNQLEKWIELGVDQIMLDNFSPKEVEEIIKTLLPFTRHPLPKIEVSGNITKENIIDYAKTGCNYISTSACMTRVHNLDLSMKIN